MKKITILLVLLAVCFISNPVVADEPVVSNTYFEPQNPVLTDSVYLIIQYTDLDGDVIGVNLYYEIGSPGGRKRVVFNDFLFLAEPENGLIIEEQEGIIRIFLGAKWHGTPTVNIKLYLVDAAGNKSAVIKQKVSIR